MTPSLRTVVYNDTEGRLRAPWRLSVTGFLFAALAILASVIALATLPRSLSTGAGILVLATVPLVITVVTIVLAGRLIDQRELADFGLTLDSQWAQDCLVGGLLGAGLLSGIVLVGLGLGWYRIDGYLVADGSFSTHLVALLLLFVSVGIYEELLARGYLLTNVAEGVRFLGPREAIGVAIAVSSLLFGVFHASNPGAGVLSTVVITLAGIMLGVGYVLTGELGLPIGIHITWNLFQGPVFGLGVSGLDLGVAVVDTRPVGPEIATGGAFGPEAGVLGLVAMLVGICLVWVYAQRDADWFDVPIGVTEPTLTRGERTDPVTE